jgi:ABC-2 type transport system permease protein
LLVVVVLDLREPVAVVALGVVDLPGAVLPGVDFVRVAFVGCFVVGLLVVPCGVVVAVRRRVGRSSGVGLSHTMAEYANYLAPGILLITIAGAAQGTAIFVAMDMTEGIMARFRTTAIFRPSVLTGHVLGSLIQTLISAAVVIGIALLICFRPTANAVEWVAAIGVLAMITFAVIWSSVACGLVSESVETASNLPCR